MKKKFEIFEKDTKMMKKYGISMILSRRSFYGYSCMEQFEKPWHHLEDKLSSARSLLIKSRYQIAFTPDDNKIFREHFEEHKNHRIQDFKEQILKPAIEKRDKLEKQIETVKECDSVPSEELVYRWQTAKDKVEALETSVDYESIYFLDKHDNFKNL